MFQGASSIVDCRRAGALWREFRESPLAQDLRLLAPPTVES
jgi:hypothetical protein